MRVLLVILQYPPDINSTGKLMRKLMTGLHRRGHEVSVVTSFPHYRSFAIEPEYRGRLLAVENDDGIQVTRLWLYASGKKQRMWHRLASYLSFNAGALVAAQASARDYDVVLCPNGSFFTGMTACVLRLVRGTPFVYNVQDLYPEVPVRAGQLRNPILIRTLELIERLMYAAASHVTVISRAQRRSVLGKGVPQSRVSFIPNFVDTEEIRPQSRDNAFRQARQWGDRTIVMHSGNLGYAYDFDSILRAADRLREDSRIRFVLVGEGVRRAELEQRARSLALPNLEFVDFQAEAVFPLVRAAADIQVALYNRESALYSLPSKIYEVMASGRPLIASAEADGEITELVRDAGAGVTIPPEDDAALADAVLRMHDEPDWREQMGTSARTFVSRHYSLHATLDAYEALLTKVVRER